MHGALVPKAYFAYFSAALHTQQALCIGTDVSKKALAMSRDTVSPSQVPALAMGNHSALAPTDHLNLSAWSGSNNRNAAGWFWLAKMPSTIIPQITTNQGRASVAITCTVRVGSHGSMAWHT